MYLFTHNIYKAVCTSMHVSMSVCVCHYSAQRRCLVCLNAHVMYVCECPGMYVNSSALCLAVVMYCGRVGYVH